MKKLVWTLLVLSHVMYSVKAFAQSDVPVLADAPGNPQVMMFIDDSGSMNAVIEHSDFDATSAVATNTANDIPSIIFREESGTSSPTTSQPFRPVLVELNLQFGAGSSSSSIYTPSTLAAATSMPIVTNLGCISSSGGDTNCPTPGPTSPQTGTNAAYLFGNTSIYGNSIFTVANLAKYGGVTVQDSSSNEYLYLSYKKEDYDRTTADWSDVWVKLDSNGNPTTLHTRVFATNGGTVKFNNKEVFLAAGWYRMEYLRWIFYGATSTELANLPGINRITAVKNVVKTLINNNASVRWGLATLNGTTLTAGTYSGNLYNQWYTSMGNTTTGQPIIRKAIGTANSTLLTTLASLGAMNGTPLTNRYIEILRYFHGETSNDSNFHGTYTSPISGTTAACDSYFIVMLTDGLPTTETSNSVFGSYIKDYAHDGLEAPDTSNSGCSTDAQCSKWLPNAAYFAFNTDFSSTYTGNQSITTYTVGLGVTYSLLDQVANYGNTGHSYLVNSVDDITNTLTNIVSLIITSPIAGAGAALAETFGQDGIVYRPRFRADTWTGNIDVFKYNTATNNLDFQFDMGTILENRDLNASPRTIIAGYDPNNTGQTSQTLPFTTGNAATWQPLLFSRFSSGAEPTSELEDPISDMSTASAQTVIQFIQGNAIDGLRIRDRNGNGLVDRLGDIVYSRPVEVGPKNGNYDSMDGYVTYTRNNSSQSNILLVGANDGMLHAFDSTSGVELWAYIPSSQVPYLERLTRQTYNSEYRRAYVDGPIDVEDVYEGGSWKTYAMFGLRKGGSTYTVLDITNRGSPKLVWEVSDAADAGQSWTKPTVIPYSATNVSDPSTYTWYMLVGTGENKATAGTNLLAYNLASTSVPSPTVVSISSTDAAGLRTSGVAAVQDDQDLSVDRLYVGTEQGDMYRVRVAGAPSSWGATVQKIFSGTNTQPIVAQPLAILTDNPQYVSGGTGVAGEQYAIGVYFGTGRYDTVADITTIGTTSQRIYGIFDPVRPANDTYANLLTTQTVSNFQNQTPGSYTVVKGTDGVYRVPNTKSGFYINLGTSINVATGNFIDPVGLVQYEPANIRGALFFSTFLPNTGTCGVGGYSFLEGVNFRTGGGTIIDYSQNAKKPFFNGGIPDLDGNGVVNSADVTQGYTSGVIQPALDVHIESIDLTKINPYTTDGLLTPADLRLHPTNGGLIPAVSSFGNIGAPNPPVISQSFQRVIVQSAYPSGTTLGSENNGSGSGSGTGSGGTGGTGGSGGSTTVPPPNMVPINIYNLPIDVLSFHEITGD